MKLAFYTLQRGPLLFPSRLLRPSLPQGLHGGLGVWQRLNAASSPSPLPRASLRERREAAGCTVGPNSLWWLLPLSALLEVSEAQCHAVQLSGPTLAGPNHELWRPTHPCSNPSMATSFQHCDCGHVP